MVPRPFLLRPLLALGCVASLLVSGLLASTRSDMQKVASAIGKTYREKFPDAVEQRNVAVIHLKNLGPSLAKVGAGETVSAFLSEGLARVIFFRVVERENLGRLLKETALNESGMVSDGARAKAGELLGADYLLDGSVSETGETVTIAVRLVGVEKGDVIASQTVSVPRSELIRDAEGYQLNSFQSAFGLNVGPSFGFGSQFANSSINVTRIHVDAGYRLARWLNVGLSFSTYLAFDTANLTKTAPIKKLYSQFTPRYAQDTYTNFGTYPPNVTLTGPGLFVDLVVPLGSRFNLGFRGRAVLIPQPSYSVDYFNFPFAETAYVSNQITNRVAYDSFTVTASDLRALPLLDGGLFLDFLISKRISVSLTGSVAWMPRMVPFMFSVRGKRQSTTQTWDGTKLLDIRNDQSDKTLEAFADANGTYADYFGYNFARDPSGKLLDFSLLAYTVGLAVNMQF